MPIVSFCFSYHDKYQQLRMVNVIFCTVTYRLDKLELPQQVLIQRPYIGIVSDPPSTKVKQTSSGNPTDGSSVTLTCDVTDGRPSHVTKVTWKKGSTKVTSGHYQLSGRDLTISSLDHSRDNGNFSCAAQNAAGIGRFSAKFQLLVNCKYNKRYTMFV